MNATVKNQKKAILAVIANHIQNKDDFKLMYRTRDGVGYRWRLNIYKSDFNITLPSALAATPNIPYMEIHSDYAANPAFFITINQQT